MKKGVVGTSLKFHANLKSAILCLRHLVLWKKKPLRKKNLCWEIFVYIQIELEIDDNELDEWGMVVEDAEPISNWRIILMDISGQFYRKGVRIGWRLLSINNIDLVEGWEDFFREIILNGERCSMKFEAAAPPNTMRSVTLFFVFFLNWFILWHCLELLLHSCDKVWTDKQKFGFEIKKLPQIAKNLGLENISFSLVLPQHFFFVALAQMTPHKKNTPFLFFFFEIFLWIFDMGHKIKFSLPKAYF